MSEQESVEITKEAPQEEQNGTKEEDAKQDEQEGGEQKEATGEEGGEQKEGGEEEGGEQTEAGEEQDKKEEVAEEGTQEEAAQEAEPQEAEPQEEAPAETQEETQEETAAEEEQAEPTEETQAEETQEQEETPAEEGQTEETPAEDQTDETPAEQTEGEQGEEAQAEEPAAEQNADEAQEETVVTNGDVERVADLELSEEQLNSLKRMFTVHSENGRINFGQFKRLLRLAGQNPTTDEAREIFDKSDLDDDGTINFEEFCRLYAANQISLEQQEAEIVNCINKVFPDGQERLPLKKVERVMVQVGLDRGESCLTKEDLENLVKDMDRNGDGKIDRIEFAKMLVARERSTL